MADDTKKKLTLAELAEFSAKFGPVMKDVPSEDDESNEGDQSTGDKAAKTSPGATATVLGHGGSSDR